MSPAEVRVLSHRRIGSDELWAIEACGARYELEKGLEFPSDRRMLKELSESRLALKP